MCTSSPPVSFILVDFAHHLTLLSHPFLTLLCSSGGRRAKGENPCMLCFLGPFVKWLLTCSPKSRHWLSFGGQEEVSSPTSSFPLRCLRRWLPRLWTPALPAMTLSPDRHSPYFWALVKSPPPIFPPDPLGGGDFSFRFASLSPF